MDGLDGIRGLRYLTLEARCRARCTVLINMMQRNCCRNREEGKTNIDGGRDPPQLAIIANLPIFLLCRKLSANRLLVSRGNLKRADDSLINSLSSFTSGALHTRRQQSRSDSTFREKNRAADKFDSISFCTVWTDNSFILETLKKIYVWTYFIPSFNNLEENRENLISLSLKHQMFYFMLNILGGCISQSSLFSVYGYNFVLWTMYATTV